MGLFEATLWCLYFAAVSAELFKNIPVNYNGNTTYLDNWNVDIVNKTSLITGDKYEVINMTLAELPPVYLKHMNSRKRSWKSTTAFTVSGKDLAATGMADYGVESAIMSTRRWWDRDIGPVNLNERQKKGYAGLMLDVLSVHLFANGMGGSDKWNDSSKCASMKGDWAKGSLGLIIGSGPTRQPEDNNSPKRGYDKGDTDLRKAWLEKWPQGFKKYDELETAKPDYCKPQSGAYIDVFAADASRLPTGSTMKLTCKAYKDFGCYDQLTAASQFMHEMVNRGMMMGTFTVYNRWTLTANMRCSVSARPFFFNQNECPLEIPGDGDQDKCVKCPLKLGGD